MPLSLLNHSALALFAQRTRIPTSARSIGFCAIWVCISSSSSSSQTRTSMKYKIPYYRGAMPNICFLIRISLPLPSANSMRQEQTQGLFGYLPWPVVPPDMEWAQDRHAHRSQAQAQAEPIYVHLIAGAMNAASSPMGN